MPAAIDLRYHPVMPGHTNELIEVACPCCGATLRIDAETGAVLSHHEPEKKPLIEDLQAAVQQLKGEADRRNDLFEKSFASHRNSDRVREKKFEELLKQAKDDPNSPPPKRLFDLD